MPDQILALAASPAVPLAQIEPLLSIAPQDAVLIAAAFATAGWLYTARRQRALARKQHTLNVMLQAGFNKEFRDAQTAVRPHISAKKCPDILDPTNEDRENFRIILNHYELISAGIRNGDFDERMVRDSQRGSFVAAWETCEPVIFKMRDDRRRQTTYEHFQWLYRRWEKKPPRWYQIAWEWVWSAPIAGRRVNPHDQ